jgi:hypothetical protein
MVLMWGHLTHNMNSEDDRGVIKNYGREKHDDLEQVTTENTRRVDPPFAEFNGCNNGVAAMTMTATFQ